MAITFNIDNFNKLQFMINRSKFYPKEVDVLFEEHQKIFGWNAGCKTCPSNVRMVIERIQPLVQGFKVEEDKIEEQQPTKIKRTRKN